MRRTWALAALVVALCGCGSAGDPQWSSKANAVCRHALAEPPGYGDTTQFLGAQLTAVAGQLTALRRIEPPAGRRKTWDEYLKAVETRRDAYAQARTRARANALGAMGMVSSNDAIWAGEGRAARALGLNDCAG
jgi:hypothetical protein